MLRKYKRAEANTKDEISKLQKILLVKDNEIVTLNEEINSLADYKANAHGNAKAKLEQYTVMAKENTDVIKRHDKLIVDMQ